MKGGGTVPLVNKIYEKSLAQTALQFSIATDTVSRIVIAGHSGKELNPEAQEVFTFYKSAVTKNVNAFGLEVRYRNADAVHDRRRTRKATKD
jgi:hypothetical protein